MTQVRRMATEERREVAVPPTRWPGLGVCPGVCHRRLVASLGVYPEVCRGSLVANSEEARHTPKEEVAAFVAPAGPHRLAPALEMP